MRGRLIAFEGIDGSGKTTQADLLYDRLGPSEALRTAEPGGTALGLSLRQLLLDPKLPAVSPHAEALMLAADRAEHVSKVLEPALEMGLWVVSDRYSGSTLAYQGHGRGIDVARLSEVISFATGGLEADLNVLVDVPLEVARARTAASGPDRFEALDEQFHQRVASGYLALAAADPRRWVMVDGTKSVGEVAAEVLENLEERLGAVPAKERGVRP